MFPFSAVDAVGSPASSLSSPARRDPALCFHAGRYHCFYTVVVQFADHYELSLEEIWTEDLRSWTTGRKVLEGPQNFSSPGNVVQHEGKWHLSLQSYPIPAGETYGSDASRLWMIASEDLMVWSEPRALAAEGCTARWANSPRQIDPYVIEHAGQWWCFYKSKGCLGLLVSDDLAVWREALPDRPTISSEQTPDHSTLENPCVIQVGDRFAMFFSPCREGRGIGLAWSTDLMTWSDIRYLDFPALAWAPGGPSAAMVLDTRAQAGRWTMVFHGEKHSPHDADLGIAFSEDLIRWEDARPLHSPR